MSVQATQELEKAVRAVPEAGEALVADLHQHAHAERGDGQLVVRQDEGHHRPAAEPADLDVGDQGSFEV